MDVPPIFACPCCGSVVADTQPVCPTQEKLEECQQVLAATEAQLASFLPIRQAIADYHKARAAVNELKARGFPVGNKRMMAIVKMMRVLSKVFDVEVS